MREKRPTLDAHRLGSVDGERRLAEVWEVKKAGSP